MSAGLSDISDADLMRMLAQSRSAGDGAPAPPPPAAPFPPLPGADPGALSIRVRSGQGQAFEGSTGPQAVDLSHLSDEDLMRQLHASRQAQAAPPPAPAEAAPPSITAPDFNDRYLGDLSAPTTMASQADTSSPLGAGLRAKADEAVIGAPSGGNDALAGALSAMQGATLNIGGNAVAGLATVAGKLGVPGYGNHSFGEYYERFHDILDAHGRQSPKSAIAGVVGGSLLMAPMLPSVTGARAAGIGGRAVQAAVNGGAYGLTGEAIDSRDLTKAGVAGLVGFGAGGALSPAIEKMGPPVLNSAMRALAPIRERMGFSIAKAAGGFTPEAEAALREIGLDPTNLPPDLAGHLERAFAAKGVSPAVAREGAAAEFGIPLSRGQATQDPRAVSMEADALAGGRGGRAQTIGNDFAARQSAAVDTARVRFQGMAARGGPVIDNPASAAEAVSDRARQAAASNANQIARAQAAQEAALGAVRPPGSGDALDAATTAAQGIRDAAERSRGAYREAYGEVGRIPGNFAPGALDDVGAAVRRSLGPEVPIDPVLTPAANRALADLDNLTSILGLREGEGATLQQLEQVRKRLVSYYGSTAQNPTDRRALRAVMEGFDQRAEDLLAVGRFGTPSRATGEAAGAVDDFPGSAALNGPSASALPSPAVPRGNPETMGQFIARNGGMELSGDARANDLHKWRVGGLQPFAREGGTPIDAMRDKLVVAGFIRPDDANGAIARDIRGEVMEALRAERQGRPTYRYADEGRASAPNRDAARIAEDNAEHAASVDRQARRMEIDFEGMGLAPRDIDRATLRDAAERMVLGHTDDPVTAYEQAVARHGEAPQPAAPPARTFDDAPFPEIGQGTSVATSDALPIGDTAPATALREARGLFRAHKEAFSPRGPGDDAGRLMRKIVEQDATPTEVATALFGSMTRPGETGLSVRFAARLREALGDDSPVLDAVRQGLIARAIDGNGTGDVGRRLDTLLRGNGRGAANAILTQEQRRGLGAFRAALHQAEQAHQALPSWISDLSRSGFDPNAVATGLFGSGVPGSRVGSANFARGLKGFLGEGSEEWSGLRQAAIQNLTQPNGRTLTATQEADRVSDFVNGKGAGLAREMFVGEELARLTRYAAALRSTVLPSGIGSPTAGQGRTLAANLLNGLFGAIAFKSGLPTAAAAPFTAKAGQRIVIGGPGAFGASRSFGGGAPGVVPDTPEHFQRLGQGAGRAAGLLTADGVPSGR